MQNGFQKDLCIAAPLFNDVLHGAGCLRQRQQLHPQSVAFPYQGDFGGQTVRILTVATERHLYGEQQFVANEELSGNVINDAVAERNNLIEQQYGLKIEVESAQYPSEEIKNYFLTGDAKYDLVCESVDRMVTQISENYYWSLDDLLVLLGSIGGLLGFK